MVGRWGPAEWKRLPDWAIDLERRRWIDSRRVTRAINEPPVLWWLVPPWLPVAASVKLDEAIGG